MYVCVCVNLNINIGTAFRKDVKIFCHLKVAFSLTENKSTGRFVPTSDNLTKARQIKAALASQFLIRHFNSRLKLLVVYCSFFFFFFSRVAVTRKPRRGNLAGQLARGELANRRIRERVSARSIYEQSRINHIQLRTYGSAYRYRRSTRAPVRTRCKSLRKLLPHRTFRARSMLRTSRRDVPTSP